MPPQHNISLEGLRAELRLHNDYFDSVANMIPARLYVAGASGDAAYHPKYMKGQHKESKEARRARNKAAKRDKFDPDKLETTLEVKKRLKREMEERSYSDDDGSGDDVVVTDGDGEGEDENDAGGEATTIHPEKVIPRSSRGGNSNIDDDSNESYASRIEVLRAKLHAKMAKKRTTTGTSGGAVPIDDDMCKPAAANVTTPALVSKRAARRAEKRRRREAAKQRNKKKASSVVEHKDDLQEGVVNLGGSKYNDPSSRSASYSTTAAGDLVTIDFQALAGLKPKLEGSLDNKSLSTQRKKSLEKLLADALRKQARLKELKESGTEASRAKAKSLEWREALKVADGENLRKTNDPRLLKKALKRKAKKKAASVKAWNARLDQAKGDASKRQQIRTHNINARKVGGAVGANLSSKRIVERNSGGDGGGDKDGGKKWRRLGPHSSRGGNRAGFEGKMIGFINDSGSKAVAGGVG